MNMVSCGEFIQTISSSSTNKIERRGRVVNTPVSYPGGTALKSSPGDHLSSLSFRGFPRSLQEDSGIVP
jgi:hypothetical protein